MAPEERDLVVKVSQAYFTPANDALLAFDRRGGLSRIKAPTLVMACADDYITPSYYSEALARAIPNAKLVIPHGGGHAFSKTRTEEYNRIVLDFLGAAA